MPLYIYMYEILFSILAHKSRIRVDDRKYYRPFDERRLLDHSRNEKFCLKISELKNYKKSLEIKLHA